MNNFFMPQQQPTMRKQYQLPQRAPEYSFWDRMTMSRPDVFKLILLSFVIVLGISIEKFASHYINSYLTDNILSPIQELLIRLSYPILIFLFIWIIKSL
jgi:ABC-type bacteriocin/lantibiotic exporter with double-glycine peptidase domain